jgi:hypothetical protein
LPDNPPDDEREQRRLEFQHRIEIARIAARKKPGSDSTDLLKVALAAQAAALINTKGGT